MNFKVSTNIKNILGKDLISNKFIAIFELVKNSSDAGARNINIEFCKTGAKNDVKDSCISTLTSKIVISDDGVGMSIDEIQNKWLFIAFSEKRHGIKKNKFAGSKGIGRFSCDRLGSKVTIYTKKLNENKTNKLVIDWDLFEKDDLQNVENIELEFEELDRMPNDAQSGTVITIEGIRHEKTVKKMSVKDAFHNVIIEENYFKEDWTREDLIKLRRELMKLVSPEKAEREEKIISIIAKHEVEEDCKSVVVTKTGRSKEWKGFLNVNGPIINDIFEKMGVKSTSIEVNISDNGEEIETMIEDRGEFVFRIKRKNQTYDKLTNIFIKVFYLNRAAKNSFTRQMGLEPVRYGSIFLYKNGYRIYPYGSAGEDFFGINARKVQGYNRFLGTRDLIGRLEINGDSDYFVEKTSRDGGFIQNAATEQLLVFFMEEVMRTLEKYVVDGLAWGDGEKKSNDVDETDDGLMPIDIADKISLKFANLSNRGDIISAEINPSFREVANPQTDTLLKSIKGLDKIARETNSIEIREWVDTIKAESKKLRQERQEAQQSVDLLSESLRNRGNELRIREQQIATMRRKQNINSSQYEDALHIICVVSSNLKKALKDVRQLVIGNSDNKLLNLVTDAIMYNERIYESSYLALNYDYGIGEKKPRDIVETIKAYIRDHWAKQMNIYITMNKGYNLPCNFEVPRLKIIIDNILSNSKKAKAKNIEIIIQKKESNVSLTFVDDGIGLSKDISNPDNIFERGYTTTFGFGLGLYHVKEILKDMNGSIHIEKKPKHGFALEVLFKYEYKF